MTQNSNYQHDPLPSVYHRILGKVCCLTDIDCIELASGSIDGVWCEYNYQLKTICFIDYKRVEKSTSVALGKLNYYIHHSDVEMKTPVPVFAVFTFLDKQFPIKCFFVKPENHTARELFKGFDFDINGKWMSFKFYSQFQHYMRNADWNENELINQKNIDIILRYDPTAPVKHIKTLGDLSNKLPSKKQTQYRIPVIKY